MTTPACLQVQQIQMIKHNVHGLQQLLDTLQNNDLHQFIKLSLLDIEKQAILLQDKYKTLKFENETLKYEIHKLQQELQLTEPSKCELIESKNVDIIPNIDYNSLKLGDDKWSNKIFALLSSNNINYTLLKHEAVFTCQQASKFDNHLKGASCKNLFLQDKKNKNYFIVTALEKTRFKINDLKKKITAQYDIKCSKLQFGKENILNEKLKLIKGSVTPFGILNDEKKETVLLIDKNLIKYESGYVKFHPLVNTMTISLKLKEFMDLVHNLDYSYYVVKLD